MKIIIVDDELSALHAFLDEVIGERDIEYKFFRDDKAEIEEYVSANRVEAAFLDINMPGINGMDLAAHLIGIRGDIKIVFITVQKVGVQDLDELVRKHTIGFVYKPYNKTVLDNYFCVLRHLAPELTVKMFGSFDCFVNGNIVTFTSKKSKELFALLVDRKGGFVSSEEAIGFLWEDEPVNPVTLARYRKVALRLKNILEEYGISDVVETVDGKRRIVFERVQCDLYDYLTGKPEFSHLFKGSYLTNYSWGESTLAELTATNQLHAGLT